MFRPVKTAGVVIQDNGYMCLYAQFETPFVETEPVMPKPGTVTKFPMLHYQETDGIVEYYIITQYNIPNMPSRMHIDEHPIPGEVNTMIDMPIVDILEVIVDDNHPAFPTWQRRSITLDFANHIISEFNLPFELIADTYCGDNKYSDSSFQVVMKLRPTEPAKFKPDKYSYKNFVESWKNRKFPNT